MSYFPAFNPFYEDSDSILPEDNEEITYEVDGVYCTRCNEKLGWYDESITQHNCIECGECGEYDSCICDAIVRRV